MAIAKFMNYPENVKEYGSGYMGISDDNGVTYQTFPVFSEMSWAQGSTAAKWADDSGQTYASSDTVTEKTAKLIIGVRDKRTRESFSLVSTNSLLNKTLFYFYVGAKGLKDATNSNLYECQAGFCRILGATEYASGKEGKMTMTMELQKHTGANLTFAIPSNSDATGTLPIASTGTKTLVKGEYQYHEDLS